MLFAFTFQFLMKFWYKITKRLTMLTYLAHRGAAEDQSVNVCKVAKQGKVLQTVNAS